MNQVSKRKKIREMDADELARLMDKLNDKNRNEHLWNKQDHDDYLEAFTQYKQITGKYYGLNKKNEHEKSI